MVTNHKWSVVRGNFQNKYYFTTKKNPPGLTYARVFKISSIREGRKTE